MLREKPKLFTIGQFAALHGINKKTLMWYDEIGLFKPAFIHEENGYRLYSYYQSTELEVILLLRDMNVPIRDIQEFMKNRSAGSMADLLRDKISELDRTIQAEGRPVKTVQPPPGDDRTFGPGPFRDLPH